MKKSVGMFVLLVGVLMVSSSHAAIKCKDGYQYVKGHGWIGTPYCGDKWLAQISGYSFGRIRNDPSVRYEVCQMYGRDPKVTSICGIDADPIYPFR